jgi:hypothetical protein
VSSSRSKEVGATKFNCGGGFSSQELSTELYRWPGLGGCVGGRGVVVVGGRWVVVVGGKWGVVVGGRWGVCWLEWLLFVSLGGRLGTITWEFTDP